jgi:hypothetical protein
MEWIRHLTDKLILQFLHATSHFAKELSPKGQREQAHWRDQRLKDLQALSLRSKQARQALKK